MCVYLIVHASVASNTFVIYGNGENKDLTELVPGILSQLGPESLANLRKLAETYQAAAAEKSAGPVDDDDEVPDLVDTETFEQVD